MAVQDNFANMRWRALFSQPLSALERKILHAHQSIEKWFEQQWQRTRPPLYSSVDLRQAGFKCVPVDTNLFPAGFNNLHPSVYSWAAQQFQHYFRAWPNSRRILIIPEDHTRNLHYLDSVRVLKMLLEQAGFDVKVGSLHMDTQDAMDVQLPGGEVLTLYALKRVGCYLSVGDDVPDVLVCNNDCSHGIPPLLADLKQPVVPSVWLGWAFRLKSNHFLQYDHVVSEFSEQMDTDPWLLKPLYHHCAEMDFMQGVGEDCLVRHADLLFQAIREKYKQYGIVAQPFIVVKADRGTYGMAVMVVHDVDQLRALNRKQRTRMAFQKGGRVSRVILQEGIHSVEKYGPQRATAESVIYTVNGQVVGGMSRCHSEHGSVHNLNRPGMFFVPLERVDHPEHDEDATWERSYVDGVIARLAVLAAARELSLVEASGSLLSEDLMRKRGSDDAT